MRGEDHWDALSTTFFNVFSFALGLLKSQCFFFLSFFLCFFSLDFSARLRQRLLYFHLLSVNNVFESILRSIHEKGKVCYSPTCLTFHQSHKRYCQFLAILWPLCRIMSLIDTKPQEIQKQWKQLSTPCKWQRRVSTLGFLHFTHISFAFY